MSKRVPKYRKNPDGRAFVEIQRKRIYLGKHGSDESFQMYDRILSRLSVTKDLDRVMASINERPAEDDIHAGITVAEIVVPYWDHAQGYYRKNGKPTTELTIVQPVLREFREMYGMFRADCIGPLKLKAFRQRFIDRGLKRTTCNKYTGHIVRMYQWAAENELIDSAVYLSLKAVARLKANRTDAQESDPVEPVSDADIEKTLAELSPTLQTMVQLQRLTAMRPGELCDLKPSEIDRDGDVWKYVPGSHKTEHHGKNRVVYIGKAGQAILAPFLLKFGYCFVPCKSGNGKRPQGEKYTTASYRRAIHRAAKRAGVSQWSPNQIRHTAATEIREKHGLEAAQVLLGHSRADVTQIYAEKNQSLAEDVIRKLG